MGLSWEEYIWKMKAVGEWGDQIMLAVAAFMLQCSIELVAPTFTRCLEAKVKKNPTLYIGYIPSLHFMSLEHKSEGELILKACTCIIKVIYTIMQ